MPVEVVTSPPFGGKGRWALAEVARREAEGELGIVVLDWSRLFAALVPGVESQFRDEAVSDSGSPRLVGAVFNFVAGAIVARELSAIVVTQAPAIAGDLADRFDAPLYEVIADPGDVATRADQHMRALGRTVTRAARSAMLPRCRRAGVAYYEQQHRLVGRAREVRTQGRRYVVDTAPKKPFDRALFEKGLTPKARTAINELKSLGNPDPTAANILSFLLKNPIEA